MTSPHWDLAFAIEHSTNRCIIVSTPGWPVICIKAGLTQVAISAILFNQLGALAKVRNILREVSTTLRYKGSEMEHHFKANRIAFIHLCDLCTFAQAGIHILSV